MADILTTQAGAAYPTPGFGSGGVCHVAWGTYNWAAAVSDGDILKMCRVPGGSTVIGGFAYASDLDTNATEALDIDIGWAANGTEAADPDGFGNFGIWSGDVVTNMMPVAGNFKPFQGVLLTAGPKSFTNETTIEAIVNTNAATLTAGYFTLYAFYVQTVSQAT